jgi:putative ABC transport system permease protein
VRVRLKQQRLLELLAQSNLSQNHWAIKLGISRGHWSEIVNGKHPFPSPKTRERLLEVFAVQFDELFEIESGPTGGTDAYFQAAIAESYLIEKELGQGGMGTVYLARDIKHGRLVALKVVSPEAVSGIGVDQFLKETRYTARLEHHHILGLHDSGQGAGSPFYVMPYIRGGSLRDRLNRDKRLTVEETLRIARGVAAALTHAHDRQMLHCDVKPENILLSEDHAYVADFGISRAIHAEVLEWGKRKDIDSSAGTPAYVSPEQATGEQQLDGRSDVYSLGCMVYEMLSGEKPFTGTNTMEIVSKRFRETVPDLRSGAPHISRKLATVVERAMAIDPDDRPDSATDFVTDLEKAAASRESPLREIARTAYSNLWSVGRQAFGLNKKTRRGALLAGIWQDARYVGRSLARKPGFTAAAVLTLGLGIGATTAIFSVVNTVLLHPLEYAEPGQLTVLKFSPVDAETRAAWASMDGGSLAHRRVSTTYPSYQQWSRITADVFDDIGIYDDAWTYDFNLGSGTERLPGTLVEASVFRVLGVQPTMGRWFVEEEDVPDSPGAIVLSYGLWQRLFGGRNDAIGTTVQVREVPHTVVGVMPRGFAFPNSDAQFWLPLARASRGPGSRNYEVVGRLGRGLTVQQATAMLEGRTLELENRDGSRSSYGVAMTELRNHFVGDARPVLLIFMGAVAAVLLIACVNVVNLMLTRATSQEHEHTVRAALGAGPRRLAQQLLTESTIISMLGAVVGIGVAYVLATLLLFIAPSSIPRKGEIGIDGGVLLFTLAVAVVVGVGIGLMPAFRAIRIDLSTRLNEGTRGSSGGIRHGRLRDGLVVAQLALALVLVAGGGLLVRSFLSLLNVENGIDPRNVLSFETSLPRLRYPTAEEGKVFYQELLERIRAMPGVESAGLALYLPATGWHHSTDVEIEGYTPGSGETLEPEAFEVSTGYFQALGTPVLEGRNFTAGDDQSGPPVIVINQYLAQHYWNQRSALGGRVKIDSVWHTVVGVVADVRHRGAGAGEFHSGIEPRIYRSYAASSARSMDMLVRLDRDPIQLAPSIRRLMGSMDPTVALYAVQPLEDLLSNAVSEPRFRTLLLVVFGLASMILAIIGVYGVMAYAVAQRIRELGIRKALGADQKRIMQLVVKRGLTTTAVGLGVGVLGAYSTAGVLQSYMFNMDARDPMTFAVALAVLGIAATSACIVPALKATRVDPLVALRAE